MRFLKVLLVDMSNGKKFLEYVSEIYEIVMNVIFLVSIYGIYLLDMRYCFRCLV